MVNKKAKPTKQRAITETHLPLIKMPRDLPRDQLGKDVGFPGNFWTLRSGRVSEEEKNRTYLCTICDFEAAHRWPPHHADSIVIHAFSLSLVLHVILETASTLFALTMMPLTLTDRIECTLCLRCRCLLALLLLQLLLRPWCCRPQS